MANKQCIHCGVGSTTQLYCKTCEAHGFVNPTELISGGPAGYDLYFKTTSKYENKYTRHQQIWSELNQTYRSKNDDYNDSFGKTFQELGIVSAVTRMSDKMQRIKNLCTGKEAKVTDEALEDSLKDLANYAVMTLIEMEKQNEKM